MMSTQKLDRRFGAAIGTVALSMAVLAACATPPEGTAAPPAAPGSTAPELTDAQANVLSELESYEINSAYYALAKGLMTEECLAGRGISGYPATVIHPPILDEILATKSPAAAALWSSNGITPNSVSITPSAEVAKYGYSGAALASTPQNAHDNEYYAMTVEQQSDVQVALDGKNGDLKQIAPYEQSCAGQAVLALAGPEAPSINIDPKKGAIYSKVIDGMTTADVQIDLGQRPGLSKALASWQKCMTGKGQNSDIPTAGKGPAPSGDASKASVESEVQRAEAGAACDATTGLNKAYQEAVRAWRIEQIQSHMPELQELLTARQPHFDAAKAYLGIK